MTVLVVSSCGVNIFLCIFNFVLNVRIIRRDLRFLTLMASIQQFFASLLPASRESTIGVPSGFIEWILNMLSGDLRNKNEEEGDFESFGTRFGSSISSTTSFGESIVVFSVIKHSPLKL